MVHRSRIVPHVLGALGAALATAAGAQAVRPPPLTPGSELVRIEPGMSKPEREQQVRAHLHRHHVRRDPAIDTPPPAADRPGAATPTPAPGAGVPAVPAGATTGR